MPGFKFKLTQLVTVPGKNQQGRISARTESVNQDSVYQVKWLDTDLEVYTGTFTETELVAAQIETSTIMISEAAVSGGNIVAKIERATEAKPALRRRRNRRSSLLKRTIRTLHARPKTRSRKARG